MIRIFQTFVIQSIIYLTNGWLIYTMALKYLSDHEQSALFLWLGVPFIGLINYGLGRVMSADDPRMGRHFVRAAYTILAIWLPLLYFLPQYFS